MNTVDSVVRTLGSGETARPRLTHYASDGRIELSGRVLLNWVSKAMNLLQDAYDVTVGSRVVIDLPAAHWRTAYWTLAAWAVGATVVVPSPGSGADDGAEAVDLYVVEANQAGAAAGGGSPIVAVTLAPLARRAETELPGGVLDEAAELAGQGDVASAWDAPDPGDVALDAGAAGSWSFAQLVPDPAPAGERLLLAGADDLSATQRTLLATWAGDGSVVLAPRGASLERVAADEQVTRRA